MKHADAFNDRQNGMTYSEIATKYGVSGGVLWGLMKAQGLHHFYRVQEGLNIKLHDIETMPLAEEGSYWGHMVTHADTGRAKSHIGRIGCH